MLTTGDCNETISIVEAVFFGADGACVDIGMPSLLAGVALFVAMVVALRFLGTAALSRILPSRRRERELPAAAEMDQAKRETLQPMPYESPIQSTGAWGNKPR
ncbi:MAG: hypothetical protein GKR99_03880 [Rhodobacteraceae bacterium]|nr:hypothetical protein [Paracoccaceae bacterium]